MVYLGTVSSCEDSPPLTEENTKTAKITAKAQLVVLADQCNFSRSRRWHRTNQRYSCANLIPQCLALAKSWNWPAEIWPDKILSKGANNCHFIKKKTSKNRLVDDFDDSSKAWQNVDFDHRETCSQNRKVWMLLRHVSTLACWKCGHATLCHWQLSSWNDMAISFINYQPWS